MSFFRRLRLVACLAPIVVSLSLKQAKAQSALPVCPPPAAQEYLLLVRGESESERAEIASILPIESSVLICQYTDEVLVRAGGFTSLETANAWASYMTTEKGYESFVARPGGQTGSQANSQAEGQSVSNETSSEVGSEIGSETSGAIAYQPMRLGTGYAVLVDYGTRPEIATAVGQLVRPVGLAVYQQRAYLLAGYTTDAAAASATLQRLSDAQLSAVVVDAQQVVRLSAEVAR
ncbi:MAG: hypothetical protein WA901_12905 [Phormidesmis sp.]